MTEIDVNAIPDDWEALADAGRMLAGDMDTGRWALGDLALRVEKRYGTDALGKYASDIGIANRDTLKRYRQVSARYEKGTRGTFPALSWTHFRDAMRAGDDAELWLVEAEKNGWPTAEMARQIAAAIGKPVPPALVWSGEARIVTDGERDWFIELPREGVEWHKLRRVTVKVYEVAE